VSQVGILAVTDSGVCAAGTDFASPNSLPTKEHLANPTVLKSDIAHFVSTFGMKSAIFGCCGRHADSCCFGDGADLLLPIAADGAPPSLFGWPLLWSCSLQ